MMPTSTQSTTLPNGIMLSQVQVYDTASIDGRLGGTPHLHVACAESYMLLSGRGAVELIDRDGFRRLELTEDRMIGFSPGTVHRLINLDGMLQVLVVMQNAGLPERGDAVMTFPVETLADADRYRLTACAETVKAAELRRDRGVEGFLEIKRAFEDSIASGRKALEEIYRHSIERVRDRLPQWEDVVRQGPLRAAQQSMEQLELLHEGDTSMLTSAKAWVLSHSQSPALGMCGHITALGVAESCAD